MKKLLLIILFIPLLNYGQFIKEDKTLHIIAGAGIAGITNFTVLALSKHKRSRATLRNAKIIGFGVALLAGHLRERQGKYDTDDLLNTALGGAVISFSLDKLYKSKKRYLFE